MSGDTLTINGGEAAVVCPDLEVQGAVIHVIDGVLQPPSLATAGSGCETGSSGPCQLDAVERRARLVGALQLDARLGGAELVDTLSDTLRTVAARPGERPPDAGAIRAARLALIGDTTLTGEALASALAHQADSWFAALGEVLPRGWALMAVGGYARGALCPGSDLDVVLLHPTRARGGEVKGVAEHVWYPFWDAGLKLSPAAHSPKSLLQLARGDLVTATSILGVRPLAGDRAVVHALGVDARVQWRKRPLHWLRLLLAECEERWARAGEVSSLLEPNLKDGRGGLRDRDVLHWAVATGRDDVIAALEAPLDELEGPAGVLYAVRCELHRVTGRPGNVFMLQEQDAVARAMRVPNARGDADVLMRRVSAAARAIDWAGGRFWRRVDRVQSGRTVTRRQHALPEPIPGAALVDDELDIVDEAAAGSPRDESFPLRIAGAASRLGVPLSRRALAVLADQVHADRRGPTTPWPERTRRAFVGLLGSGPAMVTTVESLEHYGVFSHYLPEWQHVRSLPQRNAFHLYNVDRHLLRTVANANELVRTVGRPDLLLVGALMHDIGKGYPSDHTDVGMEIVDTVLPRMGFGRQDTAVVRAMVEHHLLLAETATRRDLSDPRTAANVAAAVGDLERLHLLRALTEADSLATGPSAWSPWKQHLVDQLVDVVALDLRGRALPTGDVDGEHALRRAAGPRPPHRCGGDGARAHRRVRGAERGRARPHRAVRPGRRHARPAPRRRHRRRGLDQRRRRGRAAVPDPLRRRGPAVHAHPPRPARRCSPAASTWRPA